MLNRTKILTRLLMGFSLILLATLYLGALGGRSIERLAEASAQIFRHPFTVTTRVLAVKADLLVNQKTMLQLVHAGTRAEVDQYEEKMAERAASVDRNMAIVRERFLGNKADVDDIDRALAAWRAAKAETLELIRNGRRAEAIALADGRNAVLAEALLKEVDDVTEFAANRAVNFMRAAEEEGRAAVKAILTTLGLILLGGIAVTVFITRSVKASLRHAVAEVQKVSDGSSEKARLAEAIGAGDLSAEIVVSQPLEVDLRDLPNDELGDLLKAAVSLSKAQCTLDAAFNNMTRSLRHGRQVEQAADWLKSGLNELNSRMRGDQALAELANKVLGYLAEYLKAGVGALYLYDEEADELALAATYACPRRHRVGERIRLGEGLIGQAARQRKTITLSDVPDDYLPIGSALGGAAPKVIVAIPLLHGQRLVGAIEIGAFGGFSEVEQDFLDLAREGIAIALSVNLSRQRLAELLEETQQQTEELRVQQEELQQSNEELEERAHLLEQQRESIRVKNEAIEVASEQLRQKAVELERVSTYKSEFLANMSHELRTPLNSLMILSSLLMENKDGRLSDKQVEYAATINSAGTDLLNLISDILDLAKVEAGQMRFDRVDIAVADLCCSLRTLFAPLADQKGLALSVEPDAGVPALFLGDEQRVLQILKNLLSNAIKFTERGQVALRLAVPAARDNPLPVPALAFVVSDTGIGISPAQQQVIFEAFRQADGSISRKYGGTGLGLSISLQLARKMQGEIRLQSQPGEGSVFTLYLPLLAVSGFDAPPRQVAPALPVALPEAAAGSDDDDLRHGREALPDDRGGLTAGDKSILIIEDDLDFTRLLENMIRERGFAVLAAADGGSGIALAERYLPSAIILDVMLPQLDGWVVMRSLKDNPRTRHIPVHFITCLEDRQKAMAMGAIGFVTKPVCAEQLNDVFQSIDGSLTKSVKKLLIVEDNADQARSMVALLDEKNVDITVAATGREAIERLSSNAFDCLVLDLGLADMSGFELLDHIQKMDQARRLPIIVHSGRELTHDDERRLKRYAESIIIKGAKSPERLLNEVSLFLHLVESKLHPSKQRMIRTALDKESMLEGRKVLLVDDDMRNIFSLSSLLADKNMTVIEAENGLEALARLEEHPDIGIVLMDIMMPEMDGYTAMREIRSDARFADLPVIAMTAKALKGDYEKCMAAGASDYIAKPIEVQKLLSLIRVWLFQRV
jgi:CheY-like chemotaxis protein